MVEGQAFAERLQGFAVVGDDARRPEVERAHAGGQRAPEDHLALPVQEPHVPGGGVGLPDGDTDTIDEFAVPLLGRGEFLEPLLERALEPGHARAHADPRAEDVEIEGLGDVVVGPGVEAPHDVGAV